MANIIITIIIALLFGAAVYYIYKAKKSGKHCIGCPDSGTCGSKRDNNSCSCCCGYFKKGDDES